MKLWAVLSRNINKAKYATIDTPKAYICKVTLQITSYVAVLELLEVHLHFSIYASVFLFIYGTTGPSALKYTVFLNGTMTFKAPQL